MLTIVSSKVLDFLITRQSTCMNLHVHKQFTTAVPTAIPVPKYCFIFRTVRFIIAPVYNVQCVSLTLIVGTTQHWSSSVPESSPREMPV